MTQDTFPKKPPYLKDSKYHDDKITKALCKATPDEWKAYVFLTGYDKLVRTGVSQSRLIELCPPRSGAKPLYVRRKREIAFAQYSYLSGDNEVQGREALMRVLRKCLPNFLSLAFADLFDSKGDDSRKLVFQFLSTNERSTSKDRAIADFIELETIRRGGKKPPAKEVMGVFGLKSRQAVTDALKRDKERHPALYEPGNSARAIYDAELRRISHGQTSHGASSAKVACTPKRRFSVQRAR